MSIIAGFQNLHNLFINDAPLNGRYPVLFGFPNLRQLSISKWDKLKWDLDMLSGLPKLEILKCEYKGGVGGNIESLSVLRATLRELIIRGCDSIEGDLCT